MRHFPRRTRTTRRDPLPRRGRRLAFTVVAVLIGLLPLFASELVLRCWGIGRVSDAEDPYVGFVNVRPLFRPDKESGRYEIAPERQTFFRPDSFPMEKQANEFRIFCLGGSTVQGRPYAIETSFTTWLELNLQTADPRYQWEVVNCGGVSYASYRLVPILRELLGYQPDLFIICTGHNEFLEDRTYGPVKQTPRWITQSHVWLTRLHSYNALRTLAIELRGKEDAEASQQRAQLPEEVNALLDYQGGLDDYHRDVPRRTGTIAHFQFNLHQLVAMARQQGVPVILVNPPFNLQDSPPFKYANRDDISPDEKRQFDQLWEKAKQEGIPVVERIRLLQQAIAIDDQHAAVHFHLGKCYLNQKQYEEARAEFVAALDADICPLRILSPMRHIVAEVAADHAVPLVDAQQLFEQLSRDGITGDEWFLDHVHPSMRGHQRLASAIVDEMVRQAWVRPTDQWESRRDKAFLKHLQSLDAMYYIRGQQRLEGLRRWTQGRASLLKPDLGSTPSSPTTVPAPQ